MLPDLVLASGNSGFGVDSGGSQAGPPHPPNPGCHPKAEGTDPLVMVQPCLLGLKEGQGLGHSHGLVAREGRSVGLTWGWCWRHYTKT